MYVVPAAQRRGHARRMLAHLEATAAAAGIEALVLETGLEQPEAIALYLSSGYEPVPGFGYYCGSELSRTFGRGRGDRTTALIFARSPDGRRAADLRSPGAPIVVGRGKGRDDPCAAVDPARRRDLRVRRGGAPSARGTVTSSAPYLMPLEPYAGYQPQTTCRRNAEAGRADARRLARGPRRWLRRDLPGVRRVEHQRAQGVARLRLGPRRDAARPTRRSPRRCSTSSSPPTTPASPTRWPAGWASCTSSGTTTCTPRTTSSSPSATSARAAATGAPARRRCATATTCTSR